MKPGPDFLNNKQQLFCRFLARGELQLKAYELAGYTPNASNASNLANRPQIKAYVAELKEEFQQEQERHEIALANARRLAAENGDPEIVDKQLEWSAHRVMDLIAENARLAQVANQYGAANDSLKMLAEAVGMLGNAKAAKELPPANPLAFIGQVVNQLGKSSELEETPMKSANPLAPKAG
jgi:hypothetical protein